MEYTILVWRRSPPHHIDRATTRPPSLRFNAVRPHKRPPNDGTDASTIDPGVCGVGVVEGGVGGEVGEGVGGRGREGGEGGGGRRQGSERETATAGLGLELRRPAHPQKRSDVCTRPALSSHRDKPLPPVETDRAMLAILHPTHNRNVRKADS